MHRYGNDQVQGIRPRWMLGLGIQLRVIHALMIRDVLRRFGHDNLGFFWVIVEPLLLACGVMFVWGVMGLSHGKDVAVVPFALTGYTFVTLWRHVCGRSQRIMSSHNILMYHRNVNYLDIMIASVLIEALGIFTALVVALLPLSLLGYAPGVHDPILLIGGFAFATWFSFSFGLILAALSEVSELVHHLLPPLMYLTLPLTGTFALVDWLPKNFRDILLWSPLVNCIEMIRGGVFPEDVVTHWSASYLVSCCSVLTAIGIPFYAWANKRVEA